MTSPYLTMKPRSMFDVIRAGATEAVKLDPHPVRDMPACQWRGNHRYTFLKEDAGNRVEVCMDCGGAHRAYPIGTSSRHAKPYVARQG